MLALCSEWSPGSAAHRCYLHDPCPDYVVLSTSQIGVGTKESFSRGTLDMKAVGLAILSVVVVCALVERFRQVGSFSLACTYQVMAEVSRS